MPFPKSYPETLRDLADCIEQTLGQIAADPEPRPAPVATGPDFDDALPDFM